MDVFNVNYDQDDIDLKKCHAYNPYEHDNMDKKNSLSRLDANRCKVTIKLIINLLYSNNKLKIGLHYYVIDFKFLFNLIFFFTCYFEKHAVLEFIFSNVDICEGHIMYVLTNNK
jgi:hypothetical protein